MPNSPHNNNNNTGCSSEIIEPPQQQQQQTNTADEKSTDANPCDGCGVDDDNSKGWIKYSS